MQLADILSLCASVPLNAEVVLRIYLQHMESRALMLAVLLIRKTRIYSSSVEVYNNLAALLQNVPKPLVRERMCWLVGCPELDLDYFVNSRYQNLKECLADNAMRPLCPVIGDDVHALLVNHLNSELDGLYQTAMDRHCSTRAYVTFLYRCMRFAPTTRARLNEQTDVLFAAVRDQSNVFYY